MKKLREKMKKMTKLREKNTKLKKSKKLKKTIFLNICLIISYKFGAYIKIFRYTLLTTWHDL